MRLVIIAGLGLLGLAAPRARAGWISELTLAGREVIGIDGQAATLPAYVEVSGLASRGAVDLLVIDVSTSVSRYGRILQVITLTADAGDGLGPAVRLAAGQPWPANASPQLAGVPVPSGLFSWITTQPALALFDLQGAIAPRSLMLMDRVTGLTPAHGKIATAPWNGAQLLDVLTLTSPAVAARAWGLEPIVALTAGDSLARPQQAGDDPTTPLYLAGPADAHSRLTRYAPVYDGLNPGFLNPAWAPAHVPEPASALLLLRAGSSRRCGS